MKNKTMRYSSLTLYQDKKAEHYLLLRFAGIYGVGSNELDTPTIARAVPGKRAWRMEQLLGYERFSKTKQSSPTSN